MGTEFPPFNKPMEAFCAQHCGVRHGLLKEVLSRTTGVLGMNMNLGCCPCRGRASVQQEGPHNGFLDSNSGAWSVEVQRMGRAN